MQSIVTLRDVSFELSNGRTLFNHLHLTLSSGMTALVGPNGVGKTTLARLIQGEIEPTEGSVSKNRSTLYFAQRHPPETITVDEFLSFNDSGSAVSEKLLAGIHREVLCTTLSGGQWMRVRLARTLGDQYLILDEPTNDLDREGRKIVMQFLREHRGGVLLISHDRECLELCDEVLELSNHGISKFGGGWLAYTEEKERERNQLTHALDLAKRERNLAIRDRKEQLAKQEKRNRRGAKKAEKGGQPKILLGSKKRRAQASTGKLNSATLDRSNQAVRETHQALADLKVDPVMYADLLGTPIASQKLIAEAKAFNIRFNDWIYPQDLNFTFRGNLRLALKGENGSGKSTLLNAILGSDYEMRGELRTGDLTALYLDQRCATLDDEKSIFENIQDSTSLTESEIRNGLARFLFMKEAVFQKAKELSGGERLRAALAKGFLAQTKPELLILDEPTNNLDLANVEFLENLISQFQGALILISHDETFLENCKIDEVYRLSLD